MFQQCRRLFFVIQHWAEHCARTNVVVPSRPEWRLNCKNDHIGENLLTMSSKIELDGLTKQRFFLFFDVFDIDFF